MIPSPAAMPRRPLAHPVRPVPQLPAPVLAAASRPGRVVDRYTWAVRYTASLSAPSRLVALTLASIAVRRSGVILPQYQPTIEQLSGWTGLTVDQVLTAVRYLESHGWLIPRTTDDRRFRLGQPA